MLLSPARRVDTHWPKGLRQLATPPSSCLHSTSLMLTDLTRPGGGGRSSRLLLEDSYHSFFGGGGFILQPTLPERACGARIRTAIFYVYTYTIATWAPPLPGPWNCNVSPGHVPPPNPLVKSGGCKASLYLAAFSAALAAKSLSLSLVIDGLSGGMSS